MIRKQTCPHIGNRCPCKSTPGGKNSPFTKTKSVPEFGLCILALPSSSLNSSAVSPSSPAFLPFFPSFVGGVFHCSWIRGSVWQPPLLPLGRVLPPFKRKGGERRRGEEERGSAALSHARKKGFTSSLRPQAPADYHRDTVGSFSPSAAFCVGDSFPLLSFR